LGLLRVFFDDIHDLLFKLETVIGRQGHGRINHGLTVRTELSAIKILHNGFDQVDSCLCADTINGLFHEMKKTLMTCSGPIATSSSLIRAVNSFERIITMDPNPAKKTAFTRSLSVVRATASKTWSI
jgi:hypothetical protein